MADPWTWGRLIPGCDIAGERRPRTHAERVTEWDRRMEAYTMQPYRAIDIATLNLFIHVNEDDNVEAVTRRLSTDIRWCVDVDAASIASDALTLQIKPERIDAAQADEIGALGHRVHQVLNRQLELVVVAPVVVERAVAAYCERMKPSSRSLYQMTLRPMIATTQKPSPGSPNGCCCHFSGSMRMACQSCRCAAVMRASPWAMRPSKVSLAIGFHSIMAMRGLAMVTPAGTGLGRERSAVRESRIHPRRALSMLAYPGGSIPGRSPRQYALAQLAQSYAPSDRQTARGSTAAGRGRL